MSRFASLTIENGLEWSTAAVWRAQRWLGIDIGDRTAYLWGADFDLTSYRSVGGRVRSGLLNMLMLSAWELSESSAPVFWKQLLRFNAAPADRVQRAPFAKWPAFSGSIARRFQGCGRLWCRQNPCPRKHARRSKPASRCRCTTGTAGAT